MRRAAFGCLGRDDGTDGFLRYFGLLREPGRQERPAGQDRRCRALRGLLPAAGACLAQARCKGRLGGDAVQAVRRLSCATGLHRGEDRSLMPPPSRCRATTNTQIQTDQPQQALGEPCRLPERHTEQNLHRQLVWIAASL